MINQNLLLTGDDGYNLTNSLRFRSSASAYLNRTPTTASNRKTWTWSAWVKRGGLSSNQSLFAVNNNGNDYQEFRFQDSNTLRLILDASANNYAVEVPTVVWRDVSAWYHIVLAVDTTQATSTNRVKIYVNGIQQTVSALSGFSFPAQNFDTYVNATLPHAIGNFNYNNSLYFDGYMAEVNFIDGQALTPNSFGTSNGLGVWQPIRYGGSYGTNGFYLPFTNTTSTTTLGYDFSPQGNNWTTNNISLTAGGTYDSMTDVPTLTSATAANYCVLNILDGTNMSYLTVSNANLTYSASANANGWRAIRGTIGVTSGKYRFSVYGTIGASNRMQLGLCTSDSDLGGYNVSHNIGVQYNPYDANYYLNGLTTSYGSTQRITAVFDFIFDATTGKCWVAVNGTLLGGNPDAGTGEMATFTTTSTVFPVTQAYGSPWDVNFGQRPWDYTISTASNFNRLNTFNLTTPTIGATASTTANKYMNVVTYTGTGSSLSVTGVGFQPDWTWIKGRSGATDHGLYDAVRGVQKQLESNTTTAETTETTGLTTFGSDGFTVGALAQLNTSSATYVGWNWRASNATAVTNTAGYITSTVSANTTAGFSIVTYTGNGTSGATIGHGLGVAPSMIIVKARDGAGYEWNVYHSAIGATNFLELNATTASQAGSNRWNNTAPTSSVFSLGNANVVNQNTKTYVAYCFAPIAGYSAFGSYTGNGSTDGTFVYTGFRPRWVMMKKTNGSGNWYMWDSQRIIPANGDAGLLYAESSSTESDYNAAGIDLLSNGFKLRNADSSDNGSGDTFVYAAFAENPFKYANAR